MSDNRDDAVKLLASGGAGAVAGYHLGKLVNHLANKKKLLPEPYAAPLKIFSASMGFNAGALGARHHLEKKREMNNKYLEKLAFTNLIGGYQGAKKGDKFGGTISGLATGSIAAPLGAMAGHALGRGRPGVTAAGTFGAAYLGGIAGGKLYSKVKKLATGD